MNPRQWLNAMLTRFEREIVRLNVTLSPETLDLMEYRIEMLLKRIRARRGDADRMN